MSQQRILKEFVGRVDDIAPSEKTVVAVITTDAIDSYKEVVLAKGADLKRYRNNPVVLWMHGQDRSASNEPIGKNLWIKPNKKGDGLVAATKFADTERGENLFKLYEQDILRGWSVGFDPKPDKVGPPEAKEIKANPDWAEVKRVYRAWELLEYSAVPIPANPEALTTAVSKGLWLPEGLAEQARSAGTGSDDGDDTAAVYGYCPHCQAKGVLRERRPNGNDHCQNGHVYPSRSAIGEPEPDDDPDPDPKLPPFRGKTIAQVHAEAVRRFRAESAKLARDEQDRLKGRV